MAEDTTKNEPAMTMVERMFEFPARLQMSMLAPVRAMAALIPEGDKEVYVCGYVFGEARGVSYRNNANSLDDAPATALIGAFQGEPGYKDDGIFASLPKCSERALLRSGVTFLPDVAQKAVIDAVMGDDPDRPRNPKRGDRIDKLGIAVPVVFEIGIRKSASPTGYDWVARGLQKVAQESPLDRMRKALQLPPGANLAARIEDGTVQKVDTSEVAKVPAIEAPKADKGKKSGSRKK